MHEEIEKEKQRMKIDAKMPAVSTDNDEVEDHVDINNQKEIVVEEDKDYSDIHEVSLKCSYPSCVFASMSTSPPLDVYQGRCGKKGTFHHACNINWLENKGIEAELCKLCISVCSQYAEVKV